MRIYSTVNDITTEVAALFRNITGRAPLTAVETDIVYGSIIDAMQTVLLEYGVSNFRFNEEEVTLTTTAGTTYVDLAEYVYKVVSGTVRIPAHSRLLSLIDEQAVFAADPDLSQTGIPKRYMYGASSDPNIVRLSLWPTPDAEYEIKAQVLKYPSDTISNFPAALNMAIKNKAKAFACGGLGIAAYQETFNRAYEDIIAKVKDGYDSDTPKHVGSRISTFSSGFTERGLA